MTILKGHLVGERDLIIRESLIYCVYENLIDRESAFEILSRKQDLLEEERRLAAEEKERARLKKEQEIANREEERQKRSAARKRKEEQGILGDLIEQVGKSTKRQISYQLGRSITRGIFGDLFNVK